MFGWLSKDHARCSRQRRRCNVSLLASRLFANRRILIATMLSPSLPSQISAFPPNLFAKLPNLCTCPSRQFGEDLGKTSVSSSLSTLSDLRAKNALPACKLSTKISFAVESTISDIKHISLERLS
ncbi:hypothetical protein M422DRAFT_39799 [Sphaerobolus stellatus SS14]|uniref:Uncharacterized protein n=1 Tax=Sphaerobolus stellatus (strain SS14) TaxID=990650 RepID=A0A0C9TMM8_SPHS4|nr:hypothetical protein M422DRAFT_39799 [Sphaerobolus stellatus SS14]